MKLFALGLLIGTGLFQSSSAIPAIAFLLGAFACLLIILWRNLASIFSGFLVGWIWSFCFVLLYSPAVIKSLDHRLIYQAMGTVVSLPQKTKGKTRFLFKVRYLEDDKGNVQKGPWRIRVSWRNAKSLKIGENWRLPLRIKPAHSYHNAGSWDYSGWLYRQEIRYTAYVHPKHIVQRLDESNCCWIDRLRQYYLDQINRQHLTTDVKAVIQALALGDRSSMSTELKQTFAKTGTSHLMAISGLHIGLLAGLFAWLTNQLWRRIPFVCNRIPASLAGAWVGLFAAFCYAIVTGFGVPAQRALIMLAAAAFAIVNRRRYQSIDILAVAVIAVVIHSPSVILEAGFWLSFSAVLAILLMMQSLRGKAWWVQAIAIQLGISLALYPLLLIFSMPQSVISPFVNLLLVPIFGIVIVPLSLLAVVLSPLLGEGSWLFTFMQICLQFIIENLHKATELSLADVAFGYWSPIRLSLLFLAVILLLSPLGLGFRLVGLIVFVAMHFPMSPQIKYGDYRFTLLDVGQGLSVIIETQNHTLVYDTGAAYLGGFSLADAVVLPYLESQGINKIDHLILSHGDNDHAGGASTLASQIEIAKISSGEVGRVNVIAQPCFAGQQWYWDDVYFEVIHPTIKSKPKGNDASCVLIIRNKTGASLLTGDIEKKSELKLIQKLKEYAPFEIVIAPHHGSLSSSTQAFIDAVQAKYVWYAVGYLNRYRFPRKEVLLRWEASGAENYRTDESGALSLRFEETGTRPQIVQYRLENARYWHLHENQPD